MGSSSFRRLVERAIRKRVDLRLNRGRRLVEVGPNPGRRYAVRVHPAILESDRNTRSLLVEFIRRPQRTLRLRLHRRLAARLGSARLRPEEQIQHLGMGRVHNLQELYRSLNRRYFGGRLRVDVLWGRDSARPRRESIDFGSYELRQNAIRVHPALDRPWVPRFFVEYILFHEMLHAAVGFRRRGGRRLLHPPEFLEKERRFARFGAAERWERAHLWRFVRA